MNTEVRDALPDLLNGRLSALDTATMKAHVESCADCRAELALLTEIRNARFVPAMNVARIASAIPAYGGSSTTVPRQERVSIGSRFGLLRIAAAAVLVVAGGLVVTMSGRRTDRVVASAPGVATSPAVTAPAVKPTAAEAPAPATTPVTAGEKQVASLSFVDGTEDLSDADLEQLVSDLDTIEAAPSAEPQSVTLSVDDMGIDQ